MRKFYAGFASLLFTMAVFPAAGQGSLVADSLIGFPDTVVQSTGYNFSVVIMNNGSVTYQSGNTVEAWIRRKDTSGFFGPADTLGTAVLNTQFAPGDTVVLNAFNYDFSALLLNPGHNIVVVWPKIGSIPSNADSLYDSVYFQLQGAIVESPLSGEEPAVYYNSASQEIFVSMGKWKSIEQVRIMDASGRLVAETPYRGTPVSVRLLPPGMYFVLLERERKIVARASFIRCR